MGRLFSASSLSVALVGVLSLLGAVSLSIPLLGVTLSRSLSRFFLSVALLFYMTYPSEALIGDLSVVGDLSHGGSPRRTSLSAALRKSKGKAVVLLFMHVSDYDSTWSDYRFHLFVMLILSLGGSPRRRRSTLSVVLLKSKGKVSGFFFFKVDGSRDLRKGHRREEYAAIHVRVSLFHLVCNEMV
ncbi:hypothetical protein F2Q70_00028031 [Brassica cretica]|uniref:Uncharacterized protein n=1 Tax=Brassica cretica TaxID=69181 RepID=A0A3N6REL8_BRACR|nr:hypothetical protein F2Q70_00028031 [Brassica cretica]KAF3575627.1 hypothetical protein DY000_02034656 [Brassica cretica]